MSEHKNHCGQIFALLTHPQTQGQRRALICNVMHVSNSGMARDIQYLLARIDKDGKPYIHDLTYLLAKVTTWPVKNEGVRVKGAGMDMAFHTLEHVAATCIKTFGMDTKNASTYASDWLGGMEPDEEIASEIAAWRKQNTDEYGEYISSE